MYNLVLALHIITSALLVIVILIQRGRGGGLVEALAGAESLFGTKTSSFLVKTTTILAILFFVLSTSLAFLSKQKGRSVLERGLDLEEPAGEETVGEEVQPPVEGKAGTQQQEARPTLESQAPASKEEVQEEPKEASHEGSPSGQNDASEEKK